MPANAPAKIQGYYRFPTIYKHMIIFTAEGDLWQVDAKGGLAQRLTTHHGVESHAAISPDGLWVAFSAQYEGPTEVYTMPITGGRPIRCTFEDDQAIVVGWTPEGKIIYATTKYATLPNTQLRTVDPQSGFEAMVPLHQASSGIYLPDGKTLIFTRLPFQGSHTKRYKGGTAQNIWKFVWGKEAVPLTADYLGTSKDPMWWNGRIYFASDRDGTMNLWSMSKNGKRLKQHTFHKGWDVQTPKQQNGRIVYQLGADLYLFNIAANQTGKIDIFLRSDLDQMRQRWVKNPLNYLTHWHFSPAGDYVALTSRGHIFVAPVQQGRFVQATKSSQGRYRQAVFLADGSSLISLSDDTGEMEYYKLPANGIGEIEQITANGSGFRYAPHPSPDGKWTAFSDRDQRLWIVDMASRETKLIAESMESSFYHLRWSPDSRWLAYVETAPNEYPQLKLYDVQEERITAVTSDRVDSYNPAWSPDGKWLYFLSDRHFKSRVASPWGPRQPEPYFDNSTKIYMLALQKENRSPFKPTDELYEPPAKENNNKKKIDAPQNVEIDLDGLQNRIYEVPISPGNYGQLAVNSKGLFYTDRYFNGDAQKFRLVGLEISNIKIDPHTIAGDIKGFALSGDGKKVLIQQSNAFYVFDAEPKPPKPDDKKRINLSKWTFAVNLKEEWRQMFLEAWRLERDYFYDPQLHGIDWKGLLDRHLPLVDRVTDRYELSNLIAQLVGELSALHTFVQAGDGRLGKDQIRPAYLGATWTRDEAANGYRISHIYEAEPDYPDRHAPLAKPDVAVEEGDVITHINGVSTLDVPNPALLLHNQAGQQVRLQVTAVSGKTQSTIVTPISAAQEADLRYDEWEYHNRLAVEEAGNGDIGYLHMRAMSGDNYPEWVKNYYPVFNRSGLIIDVRHNRGGNIDSWLLGKLLRKAWFYWLPRIGNPSWNMQYAFRGHIAVICNERTSSDGEAFADGFRRLGLGKIIGTRTWGGEIWLSRNNHLVDKGIATAAQIGVYDENGNWLIEGHGVDPDIVVDNLPYETYQGVDAQLEATITYLLNEIKEKPVPVPPPPQHPNLSFNYD
jgi:tricorn protease